MGEAKVPLPEIQSAAKVSAASLTTAFLQAYFLKHILAVSLDGRPWKTEITNIHMVTTRSYFLGEYEEVSVPFKLWPKDTQNLHQFTFNCDAVIHEVVTHKILVYLNYDWENGVIGTSEDRPLGVIRTNTVKLYP